MEKIVETDVLVVGGGPVGLALAAEFGLQGRRALVIERDDRSGQAPRAKTTNVRSRELFRRWGIAEALAAASPFAADYPAEVVFATRLSGHEIARFSNAFFASRERDDRYSEHAQWIPQYKVEQVMKRRVVESPGVYLHNGVELVSFEDADGGVLAEVRDVTSGSTSVVRARYLVGADGARSTVRDQLGIRMEGVSPISHHHNLIFRAPGLMQRHLLGPALMYWLVNSEVPSILSPLDTGDRWAFSCERLGDDTQDPAALIRAALGVDIDIEILGRDAWTAHQLIATSYRRGNVFLAGDACHLHPPFGGYGMNMGIGDAVDLGWKLSAVLAGWGGPALLDSYEIERRQLHQRVVDEAVLNHAASSRRFALDDIEAEGVRGDVARAEAATVIRATKQREFDSLGVVLGSFYDVSPVLVRDGSNTPPVDSIRYMPNARPGCLAPHAWLHEGTAIGASLYDHFDPRGLTLLCTDGEPDGSLQSVQDEARQQRIPFRVVAPRLAHLRRLYGARYALVRPDQFVAWRGDRAQDACEALKTVVGWID